MAVRDQGMLVPPVTTRGSAYGPELLASYTSDLAQKPAYQCLAVTKSWLKRELRENKPYFQQSEDLIDLAGDEDADSAYGGDSQSETASLTSSITNYRFEHGRRYHAYREGEYWAPNDEAQNDQLDIANHTFLLLFDGHLFQAPIGSSPQEVLDVGTGTGIWAMDFADQFPAARVIATDLSPIQPTWTPPNCEFQIHDCSREWGFRPDRFDFIHVRALYGSITDWPAFYKQVYAHLKPGGWYEQVEYGAEWLTDDDSIPPGHVLHEVAAYTIQAGEKMGKTFVIRDLMKDYVVQSGFVNVVEKRYKMPIGPWARDKTLKEIGRWHLLETDQGLEGWVMALFTRILGWSFKEVQVWLARVRQSIKDRNIHSYTRVGVVYGQKPMQ